MRISCSSALLVLKLISVPWELLCGRYVVISYSAVLVRIYWHHVFAIAINIHTSSYYLVFVPCGHIWPIVGAVSVRKPSQTNLSEAINSGKVAVFYTNISRYIVSGTCFFRRAYQLQ